MTPPNCTNIHFHRVRYRYYNCIIFKETICQVQSFKTPCVCRDIVIERRPPLPHLPNYLRSTMKSLCLRRSPSIRSSSFVWYSCVNKKKIDTKTGLCCGWIQIYVLVRKCRIAHYSVKCLPINEKALYVLAVPC